jgi:O-antigen/teichoic acid export membrane protein
MGGVIYNAVFPSVGDYNVSSNETQKKQVFNLIFFGYLWISMFFASGFISMASDIIKVWLGEKYVLGTGVVVAMSMNVFLSLIVCPVNVYRITTGIFRKTKGILIYSAILNILFSYALGSRFGLVGIIFATSLARLLTQFWFEPVVLYRDVFPSSHVSAYFGRIAGAAAIALTSAFAVDRIAAVLPLTGLPFVIVKFLIACIIPNLLFFLIFWKDSSMKQMKDMMIGRISKIIRK